MFSSVATVPSCVINSNPGNIVTTNDLTLRNPFLIYWTLRDLILTTWSSKCSCVIVICATITTWNGPIILAFTLIFAGFIKSTRPSYRTSTFIKPVKAWITIVITTTEARWVIKWITHASRSKFAMFGPFL